MVRFLAKKYASLLGKDDIMALFGLLVKAVGSQSKAANLCGLTRKATYDWNGIADPRGSTKEKVLSALIENLPEETLSHIAERAFQSAREVAMTYVSLLHSLAVQATSKDEFVKTARLFDRAQTRYAGVVVGRQDAEIGKMISDVEEQAHSLEIEWSPSPMPVVHENQLGALIRVLAERIRLQLPSPDLSAISRELHVSPTFVSTFMDVVGPTTPRIPRDFICQKLLRIPQERTTHEYSSPFANLGAALNDFRFLDDEAIRRCVQTPVLPPRIRINCQDAPSTSSYGTELAGSISDEAICP